MMRRFLASHGAASRYFEVSMRNGFLVLLLAALVSLPLVIMGARQATESSTALDAKVTRFLEQNRFG